jgi:3-oxoacyl-[acyl-carrier-protein] synthase III
VLGPAEIGQAKNEVLEEGLADIKGFGQDTRISTRADHPASLTAPGQAYRLIESGRAGRVLAVVEEVSRTRVGYGEDAMLRSGGGTVALVFEACRAETGILAAVTMRLSTLAETAAGGQSASSRREWTPGLRTEEEAGLATTYAAALIRAAGLAGVQPGDLDLVISDQSSPETAEAALEALQIPAGRHYRIQERIGNTSGGSLLVALAEAVSVGAARPGQIVALFGEWDGSQAGAMIARLCRPDDFTSATMART